MVKIYTKKGDNGTTSLVGGTRVSKNDPRVALYGSLDELNSMVGHVDSLLCESGFGLKAQLREIQRDLFCIQTYMACEVEKREGYSIDEISNERCTQLEDWIDAMSAEIKPLRNFILPGGSTPSASFHLCRTRCRAIERDLCDYSDDTDPIENELRYINRLSDYFFVAARFINKSLGIEDVLYT